MSPKVLGVIMILVGVALLGFRRRLVEFQRENDAMFMRKPLPWNSPGWILFSGIGFLILGLINLFGLYSWFPG